MKKIFIAMFFVLAINNAFAQSEADKVKAAMMDYIEGFYNGDSSKIIRSISPEVTKYGYWKAKDKTVYEGEAMSYKEMVKYAVDVSKRPNKRTVGALEKAEIFEVLDQTASGKVTAWWGTDYILLEKKNGKWMIRMVLWQGPLSK